MKYAILLLCLLGCIACGEWSTGPEAQCEMITPEGIIIRLPSYCEQEDALEPDDFGVV